MIETSIQPGRMSGSLPPASTIWQRDLLRFLSNRARILASLGQPLLFLCGFGGGLAPAVSGLGGGTVDFRLFRFPGILSMTVLFTLYPIQTNLAVLLGLAILFLSPAVWLSNKQD